MLKLYRKNEMSNNHEIAYKISLLDFRIYNLKIMETSLNRGES